MRGFDPARAGTGEGIVAPFCLLPVLLELAEGLAATDPRLSGAAYRIVRADRTLRKGWGSAIPNDSSRKADLRWAKAVRGTLSEVADDLTKAQASLKAASAP